MRMRGTAHSARQERSVVSAALIYIYKPMTVVLEETNNNFVATVLIIDLQVNTTVLMQKGIKFVPACQPPPLNKGQTQILF